MVLYLRLRQSIAELKGYDFEALLATRGKLNSDGKTNGDILKEIEQPFYGVD